MKQYKSNQEVFDHVWNHFIVNKNPPGFKDGSCAYHTETGGCAIGCLIEDKDERIYFQNEFGGGTLIRAILMLQNLDYLFSYSIEHFFLTNLQTAHDVCLDQKHADFTLSFKDKLLDLAKDSNLIIP